jgi:hypothetical protein
MDFIPVFCMSKAGVVWLSAQARWRIFWENTPGSVIAENVLAWF